MYTNYMNDSNHSNGNNLIQIMEIITNNIRGNNNNNIRVNNNNNNNIRVNNNNKKNFRRKRNIDYYLNFKIYNIIF